MATRYAVATGNWSDVSTWDGGTTLPTVGDDVYGDDPTVNELEAEAAVILGKEAALFAASGTMGNQLALMAQVQRGDEVILSDRSHIVIHEAGAAAILAGAQLRCLPVSHGLMDLDQLEATIRKTPEDIHSPKTALICLENADSDGYLLPPDYLKAVRGLADRYALPVHLDGARLFNAEAAGPLSAPALAACADTVQICLSKGLCAPVGSLLAGPAHVIDTARRKRKILGGGMRQAGILAAAGLVALREHRSLLAEDHRKARWLADQLSRFPDWFELLHVPAINLVFFKLTGYPVPAALLPQKLLEAGVLINGAEEGVFRLVTHYWISQQDLDQLLQRLIHLGQAQA